MKKILLLPVFILLGFAQSFAQYALNQNKVWVFGNSAGVNFNSGSPVPFSSSISTSEGSASVCDATTGALLFYTDGRTIWNATGGIMAGPIVPAGVFVSSATQGALIVPKIGSSTQYYVFSLEDWGGAVSSRLYCCTVDMTLGAGTGGVVPGTISATPINSNLSEKMIAVAGNSCNIWVMVHKRGANEFLAYEITGAGLSTTPVVSTTGTFGLPTTIGSYGIGVMKASPDRTRIAAVSYDFVGNVTNVGTELYDFNATTGIVSNCRVLDNANSVYGAEFSPDNTKLYTDDYITSGGTTRISQYNVSLPTTAAMIASRYTVATGGGYPQMRIGPDGKIYMIGITGTNFLDAINNPNAAGAACGFVPHAVALAPGSGVFGLPSMVVTVVPDTTFLVHDTFTCDVSTTGITLTAHASGTSYIWSTGATTASTTVTATGTYWVTSQTGCSITIDTIHVTVPPAPTFTYTVHPACQGGTVDFSSTPPAGTTFSWQFGDGTPTNTTDAVLTHTFMSHGTFNVKLTWITYGCTPSITIPITITHSLTPSFNMDEDTICAGTAITFTDASTSTHTITGNTWRFGDGGTDAGPTPAAHTYADGGIFQATMLVTNNLGCTDSLTKVVHVVKIKVDNAFHDTTLCLSMPLSLMATGSMTPWVPVPGNFEYTWGPTTYLDNPTSGNPAFEGPTGAHSYTVTAFYQPLGCTASDVVNLNVLAPAPLQNVTTSTNIKYGESVQLYASNAILYRWTPNDGSLTDPNINNPVATPSVTTTYMVYGFDGNGCRDTASLTIIVDSTVSECLPSAFTPNGDGLNDIFRPICISFQKLVDFSVFNRWGELVFHSSNMKNGWDGTFNGAPQDMGVYYYTIIVARPNSIDAIYKGDVTLIR
ncbi:MAG: PKD domain-containing protein [Bacteroidota bacterium]